MKLNRVLIVYKKIGIHSPKRLTRISRLHMQAVERAKRDLKALGIRCQVLERGKLKRNQKADLIISIGGDGTFLACAHVANSAPLLGLNSMPGYSIGFFCAATTETLSKTVVKIQMDRLKLRYIPLIEAKIGKKAIPCLALNDILFAGDSPAEMARYTMEIGKKSERQRSSGVWISSGAGSTAAILSAGGKRQNMESTKIQYLVREPFKMPGRRYSMLRGILRGSDRIKVTSNMRDARVYIDGPKLVYPVKEGETLTAYASKKTLRIFL